LQITTDNGVDTHEQYAFNWTATWTYPQGPETEPVHAFPNALLNDTSLPIQLGSLTNLTLDVEWTYAIGDVAATTSDDTALNAANLQANAAIDMFLSNDQTQASNSTAATHEVMIWLGQYGNSARPLGYPTITATENINNIDL